MSRARDAGRGQRGKKADMGVGSCYLGTAVNTKLRAKGVADVFAVSNLSIGQACCWTRSNCWWLFNCSTH